MASLRADVETPFEEEVAEKENIMYTSTYNFTPL